MFGLSESAILRLPSYMHICIQISYRKFEHWIDYWIENVLVTCQKKQLENHLQKMQNCNSRAIPEIHINQIFQYGDFSISSAKQIIPSSLFVLIRIHSFSDLQMNYFTPIFYTKMSLCHEFHSIEKKMVDKFKTWKAADKWEGVSISITHFINVLVVRIYK